MDDYEIVALYWERDESSIRETERKYGKYLRRITYGVLGNVEDCKESVNDTYLRAWNSMPPHRPAMLATFLGKLARRAAIDRLRKRNRSLEGNSEYILSLSELGECAQNDYITGKEYDALLLSDSIDRYLQTLSAQARILFIRRYYYFDSVREAAAFCGMSESKAVSILHRARVGLKNYLQMEGFDL